MELKQFKKVRLNPGEKQHVLVHLDKRAFRYFDVGTNDWRMDPGRFVIYIGDSSDAIALKQDLIL